MTIEEIINKHCQRCNIPFDTIEALCQEVRRLTIEECKEKVKTEYVNSFPTDLNKIDL